MTNWTKAQSQSTTRQRDYFSGGIEMVDDDGVFMVDDDGVEMVIFFETANKPVSTAWNVVPVTLTSWTNPFQAEFGTGIDSVRMVDDDGVYMVDDDGVEMFFDYSPTSGSISTVWQDKEGVLNTTDFLSDFDGELLVDHDGDPLIATLDGFKTNRTRKL